MYRSIYVPLILNQRDLSKYISKYYLVGTFYTLAYFYFTFEVRYWKKSVSTYFSNFQPFHNLGWIPWRPGIKGIRARHGSKPHHNSHGTYWRGRFRRFRRRFRRFWSWILIRNCQGNLLRGIDNCLGAAYSMVQVC